MGNYLNIREVIGDFKTSMDLGALYWEFLDGSCIAMHESIYLTEYDDNGTTKTPYRDYIDTLIRERGIKKVYYKSYDIANSGEVGVWVNIMKLWSQRMYNGALSKAYIMRDGNTVNVDGIKKVKYLDANRIDHIIDKYDGAPITGDKCQIYIYPVHNNNLMKISQYNREQPNLVGKYHLKQDLLVTINDIHNVKKFDNNILVWVNGLFVPYIALDDTNIVIPNGKSYLDTRVVSYKDTGVAQAKAGTIYATADPVIEEYRFDLDIRIFSWKGITISGFDVAALCDYDFYEYFDNDTGVTHKIDYPARLVFDRVIDENHLLIQNGTVVDRDRYTIEGSKVILKFSRDLVENTIRELKESGVQSDRFGNIVESYMPSGADFNIVFFTPDNDDHSITLHRSDKCYRNFPYSFHVTFPDFDLGDIVLLDGVYEKYVAHTTNSIAYPYNKYLARYKDNNILNETKVERIFFMKS